MQNYYTKSYHDKFSLQLYQGVDATYTIKEILEHGRESDNVGDPLYPCIMSICLIGVSLQQEDINLLVLLVKEKKVEYLSFERVFLSSDKIIQLLTSLQNTTHLKSLLIKSMELETDEHAPLVNKLLESCPFLTRLVIKDSKFNKNAINYHLINFNKTYTNTAEYLSLIRESNSVHLFSHLKKKLYQELENYNNEATTNTHHYNKLLTEVFFTIGEAYQRFALPAEANHYFKRIKKCEDISNQDENAQKALTLYSLNKYAEGCESIINGNPINAIVPIAHAIESALNTKDVALLERAETSLRNSISEAKEKIELLSSPPAKRFKIS